MHHSGGLPRFHNRECNEMLVNFEIELESEYNMKLVYARVRDIVKCTFLSEHLLFQTSKTLVDYPFSESCCSKR